MPFFIGVIEDVKIDDFHRAACAPRCHVLQKINQEFYAKLRPTLHGPTCQLFTKVRCGRGRVLPVIVNCKLFYVVLFQNVNRTNFVVF